MIDASVIQEFEDGVPFFPEHLPCFANTPSRNVVLLALLMDYIKVRKDGGSLNILEVGSRAGGSALAWVDAINLYNRGDGSITCVDMWYKLGAMDDVFFSIFRHNVKATDAQDLVIPIIGDSTKVLPFLPRRHFDLVYIDGAHCFSICTQDMRNAKALVKPGGIICGDDLEIQFEECDKDILESFSEHDAAFDPSPWHPGVTRAVHDNFGRLLPFFGVWAVQKAQSGDAFEPVDIENIRIKALPSYFPAWASRLARHELKIDSESTSSWSIHETFLDDCHTRPSWLQPDGDTLATKKFAMNHAATQLPSAAKRCVGAINQGDWRLASDNGEPEYLVSEDAIHGLTISVINPKGTTDIGIQLVVPNDPAMRGKKATLRACLRTNGLVQLNIYDGVLGFGSSDTVPDSNWQTLTWETLIPPDAEMFVPQIRMHSTHCQISPATQLSVAWLTVDVANEEADPEQVAGVHLARALHHLEHGDLIRSGAELQLALKSTGDPKLLYLGIERYTFADSALRDEARELLLRHLPISA